MWSLREDNGIHGIAVEMILTWSWSLAGHRRCSPLPLLSTGRASDYLPSPSCTESPLFRWYEIIAFDDAGTLYVNNLPTVFTQWRIRPTTQLLHDTAKQKAAYYAVGLTGRITGLARSSVRTPNSKTAKRRRIEVDVKLNVTALSIFNPKQQRSRL